MTISIAPIVEGHGEKQAIPMLLRRICAELLQLPVVVLQPIRIPKSKLIKPPELLRAVTLAHLKLADRRAERSLVLVVFDADEDAACELAPKLVDEVTHQRPELDIAIVLAVPEYETWFIAAAESLGEYLELRDSKIPDDVDASRLKKGWLHQRFRGRYTETIEQPALTAKMDLVQCRSRSRSFDKLCREIERRRA